MKPASSKLSSPRSESGPNFRLRSAVKKPNQQGQVAPQSSNYATDLKSYLLQPESENNLDAEIKIQQNYSRLKALKMLSERARAEEERRDANQLEGSNFGSTVKLHQHLGESDNLTIPDHLTKKVPLHWHQFFEDVQAELVQVTSEIYDGGVSKGLKNGVGQVILPSGEAFKGNWKNDLRHGSGVCRFPNGSIYKGEWREGAPQGQGIFYSRPNEIVEGRFDGWRLADGIVKILFSNGEFYEGNLRDGMRELTGVMHYANGDIYEGEWAKDKRVSKRAKLVMADG